jgi:hypothetical protein
MAATTRPNAVGNDTHIASVSHGGGDGQIMEKSSIQLEEHEEKVQVRGDYSGAVSKTTPEEVKLVRKLDIWIMVHCQQIMQSRNSH